MSKTKELKNLLTSGSLEFLMEAHSGLSAKIVEESGFKGIWGSGLSISAQFGVRDNNEASWTQVLEVVEFMADATTIPILLDGDTGYGNFNSVRRLVKKLEQRGVAGVCIEDKEFPKTNSLLSGGQQPLAEIDEFCGRIKAGKDSQTDDHFCIVARVEAFIAGWGLEEALKRAHCYVDAGADAILIHSRLNNPDEIIEFCKHWGNRAPLVIVPTKYYSTPTDVFRKAGISVVVWGNQVLRASLIAMQRAAHQIFTEESLINVEDRLAPLTEVFRIQRADELLEAEKKYFASAKEVPGAIVLAASRGEGFGELTKDRPKCMLPISGRPILEILAENLRTALIREINVVVGYEAEKVQVEGIRRIHNKDYETTNELVSLSCALDAMGESTLILYGDVLFRRYVLEDLLRRQEEIVIVVDSSGQHEVSQRVSKDLLNCTSKDTREFFDEKALLKSFASYAEDTPVDGEWIGLMKVQGQGCEWLRHALDRLRRRDDFTQLEIPDLLQEIHSAGNPVHVMYVSGHWVNLNRLVDIDEAATFLKGI